MRARAQQTKKQFAHCLYGKGLDSISIFHPSGVSENVGPMSEMSKSVFSGKNAYITMQFLSMLISLVECSDAGGGTRCNFCCEFGNVS